MQFTRRGCGRALAATLALGAAAGCNAILDNPKGHLVGAAGTSGSSGTAGAGAKGGASGKGGKGAGGKAGRGVGGGSSGASNAGTSAEQAGMGGSGETTEPCGNGVVEGSEACDDGNRKPGDGCDASCNPELGWSCTGTEPTTCTEICGDGIRVGAEALAGGCDDGGTKRDDGCTPDCKVEAGWFCTGAISVCEHNCGNGKINGQEECDDGNMTDGDGCASCAVEAGFTCTGAPSRCETTCGDGITAGDEECDGGPTPTADCDYGATSCQVCDASCKLVAGKTHVCGDGVVDPGEGCDQGNALSGDGCSPTCKVESGWQCGDSPSACARSCKGLDATCGSTKDASCCQSSVIPGGTFNRGNHPEDPATISAYHLDTFEVTVGRFRRFVTAYADGWRPDSTIHEGKNLNDATDKGWLATYDSRLPADDTELISDVSCSDPDTAMAIHTWTTNPGSTTENRPINCIDWFVAYAFCIWDGGRLPTEAELNFAGTGGDEQRNYPWSDPPTDGTVDLMHASYSDDGSTVCNADGTATCSVKDLLAVGSLPAGNGRFGQADLGGNVQEWTLDTYVDYPNPCNDCSDHGYVDGDTNKKAIKGGSFDRLSSRLHNSARVYGTVGYIHPADGMRCARNL